MNCVERKVRSAGKVGGGAQGTGLYREEEEPGWSTEGNENS